jgi:hypothetical protein
MVADRYADIAAESKFLCHCDHFDFAQGRPEHCRMGEEPLIGNYQAATKQSLLVSIPEFFAPTDIASRKKYPGSSKKVMGKILLKRFLLYLSVYVICQSTSF